MDLHLRLDLLGLNIRNLCRIFENGVEEKHVGYKFWKNTGRSTK